MTNILKKSFDLKSRTFSFFCGDQRVCQTGFLILIGLNTRESRPPKHWLKTVKEMQSDAYDPYNPSKSLSDTKTSILRDTNLKRLLDRRTSKFMHATNYILYIAQIFADTCPTNKNIRAVPYESVSQLFEEYEFHCIATKVNLNCQAKRRTFDKAFNKLGDQVKLVGAKGNQYILLNYFK